MELAVELVLMPSAESRLLTVLRLNLLNYLVCASLGLLCRVLVVGTTVPRASPGWPQTGGCSLHLALNTDAETSHLVPFLGTRCAHRLLPDITSFP